MSITNIKTCYDIMAALSYQQTKNGKDRCAAKRSNIEPFNFSNFARMAIADTGRKVQGFTIIQAFSPEELQNTPVNIELVNLLGCELAARAFSGCPYQCITHTDSRTGHLHNHISVLNYDLETGNCMKRDSRWLNISRINDRLMDDYGMEVCHAQTQNADQKAYFDRQQNPDKYIWQDDLQERVRRALDHAISPGDFASRLKAEGVTAKIYRKDGKTLLKHMIFIFKGTDGIEHRKRGNKMSIGNECTPKELMEKFAQNAAEAKEATLSENITATAETLNWKAETPAKPANAKAHTKTSKKTQTVDDTSVAIYRHEKEKAKEEKKKKKLRMQLLELQRRRKAEEEKTAAIKEKLESIIDAIEASEEAEEIEWLEEKEKQLQRQLKDWLEECLKLDTKEKEIRRDLSGEQITLNPQLEMGYEINKARQKRRDSEGISFD